ncbi:DNA-3-methyladenine glycosylase [Pseudarthrobacter sp. P1]|uniref:DNA-3-methyladenine glycosylase n=1 Tax=Pseudarthrobacter sp. P1 TaxID=3418418 RepID=UPI003CF48199
MDAAAHLIELLGRPATEVAPLLLGATLSHTTPEGTVTVRLTEMEAYLGAADSDAPDPGSHSYRGPTARNAAMFGPPGRLYVYFTYGMHYCANVVCGPEGTATGVLLRAGEVLEGLELARLRRPASRSDKDLAQGPARLATALGLDRRHYGMSVLGGELALVLPASPPDAAIRTGPRVGLAPPGGTPEYPWRFWLDGDPTVSTYKPAVPKRRTPPVTSS